MVSVVQADRFFTPDDIDHSYRLDESKTIVNVGSIGQPRDGRRGACYALLETDAVRFVCLDYNWGLTARKLCWLGD